MLRALLWKQWRETRLIIGLFIALTIIGTLILNYRNTYAKYADLYDAGVYNFFYLILWAFLTMLIAAVLFCSEQETGTHSFLVSKPIPWWKLWRIKTLYGIVVVLGFGAFIVLINKVILHSLRSHDLSIYFGYSRWFLNTSITLQNFLLVTLAVLVLYFISCFVASILTSSLKAVIFGFFLYFITVFLTMTLFAMIAILAFHKIYLVVFALFFLACYSSIHFSMRKVFNRYSIFFALISFCTLFYLSIASIKLWRLFFQGSYYIGQKSGVLLEMGITPVLMGLLVGTALICSFSFAKTYQQDSPRKWIGLFGWSQAMILTISSMGFIWVVLSSQQILYYEDIEHVHSKNTSEPLQKKVYFSPLASKFSEDKASFATKHLVLNKAHGKLYSYGAYFPSLMNMISLSSDSKWALYEYPIFRFGLAQHWGIWAENIATNKRYLLLKITKKYQGSYSKWSTSGNWCLLDVGLQTVLISFANKKPLIKARKTNRDNLFYLHLDNHGRLYTRTYGQINTFSYYNLQLEKKDIFFPLKRYWYIFASNEKYLILSSRKKGKSELWLFSLNNFKAKKISHSSNPSYQRVKNKWSSLYSNFFIWRSSHQDKLNKLHLTNLSTNVTTTLLTAKAIVYHGWSGDGKSILVNVYNKKSVKAGKMQLLKLNPTTLKLTSHFVAKKALHFLGWSGDSKKALFRLKMPSSRILWILDFSSGKWSKIKSSLPFDLVYIDNRGRVYIVEPTQAKIYRLSQDGKTQIIY